MIKQQPLPPELLSIGEAVSKLPGVIRTSPHTTSSGGWGLTVQLNPRVESPAAKIESVSGPFPVRYVTEYHPPEARPAYPERGE